MIFLRKNKLLLQVSILFFVAFMVGCASIENYQPLENVKNSYSQLQQNNTVSKYAAAQLYDANQLISKAESALKKNDKKLLDHYVYLSENNLQLAEVVANQKKNETYLEDLSEQRSDLLIHSRTKEVQQARQEAQEARNELETYKTKNSERGTVLVLDNLLFETGGATLHIGSQRNLDPLVRYLHDNTERNISVEGHTDNVGGESFNVDLSFRRAEAVKNYLVSSGIDGNRIGTKGFGESMPVTSNSTPQGRQLNRRVEIVILD